MRASLAERREVATLAPAAAIGVRREHVPGHGRPDGERDRAGLRAVRAAGIVRTFCRVAGLNGWPWLMALMAASRTEKNASRVSSRAARNAGSAFRPAASARLVSVAVAIT
jgi:hypothetical protein